VKRVTLEEWVAVEEVNLLRTTEGVGESAEAVRTAEKWKKTRTHRQRRTVCRR
jgi:hypothetical protein